MSSSLLGVAVGTNSTTHGMLLRGVIEVTAITGVEDVGSRVYVGEANGVITTTVPAHSGDIVRIIGYTLGTNKIYFNPSTTWIKIA